MDCHCWHEYRQSFIHAITKMATEAINMLTTTIPCRLRRHQEHDGGFSRFVDQCMAQIRTIRVATPTASCTMGLVLTLLQPA